MPAGAFDPCISLPSTEKAYFSVCSGNAPQTSPADIVIKAADEFRDKTTASNQLWQTDFTYLMVIGWGWYALSTVLDDFSRYIVVWKLCATMQASDVTATLDRALADAGLDHVHVVSGLGGSPTTGRATSRGISPTGSAAGA